MSCTQTKEVKYPPPYESEIALIRGVFYLLTLTMILTFVLLFMRPAKLLLAKLWSGTTVPALQVSFASW